MERYRRRAVQMMTMVLALLLCSTYVAAQCPSPEFSSSANLGVGLNPRNIASGDLNRDGFLDFVVANSDSNSISILLGQGNGSVSVFTSITVNASPRFVAISHLNDDGFLDIAVSGTGSLFTLLGQGNGFFNPARAIRFSGNASSIITSDFNRDGFIDLALADEIGAGIALMFGRGNGLFRRAELFDLGISPSFMTSGDFNKDGLLDLAVSSDTSSSIFILLGQSGGTFSRAITINIGSNTRAVAVGDFNSDGLVDLAVASDVTNRIFILIGVGDGSCSLSLTLQLEVRPTAVTTGDFNGDGFLDLVVTNSTSGNSSILFGRGDGSFCSPSAFGGSSVVNVISADVDNDGRPDLVFVNADGTISVVTNTARCSNLRLNSSTTINATVGESFNVNLSATGGTAPFGFTVIGGMPSGVTLTNLGALGGTPTAAGNFTMPVRVTDATGCEITTNVTLRVNGAGGGQGGCPTIRVTAPSLGDVTVGSSVNASFSATGGSGSFTFAATGNLPAGLTLNADGTLTGTVTATGNFNFNVRATDTASGCVSGNAGMMLRVKCPTITVNVPTMPSPAVGGSVDVSFSATGGSGNFTFTASGLPAGLTLSSSGQLSGTVGEAGTINFSVTATDAFGCTSGTAAVTINVTGCPAINVTLPDLSGITAGGNVNVRFDATGGSGSFNFSASGLPAGLTLLANGRLQGTINASGDVSFTVTATDAVSGCASASTTVTINVGCPNLGINMSALPALTINDAINAQLTASGGSGNYNFELVAGAGSGLPAGVSLSAEGAITGTIGGVGRFFFTVRVTDTLTGCSVDVPFELPVGCDSLGLTRGTLPSLVGFGANLNGMGLSASGSGGLTFELIGGGLPAGVTLNADGTFSGNAGGVGNFFFTVRATDANGCFGEAELNIIVDCPNITISGPTTINATANSAIGLNAFSVNGASTALVNLSAQGVMPAGVTFDSTTGAFVGVPTQTGTFTINLSATDDNNCQSTAGLTVTIVVNAAAAE